MRKTSLIGIIIILALILFAIFQGISISRLSDEVDKQKANVQTLVDKEKGYKICDSINVTQINALQLDKDQFEKLVLEKDKQISQLKNQRKKDIEYYSKLSKSDTVRIDNSRIDTIYIDNTDTCVGFMDKYVTYLHCNNETLITTRDTIKQVISKHYKHKFLWWKWKVDGFTQDIWSTNPHSTIHFEEFVKAN